MRRAVGFRWNPPFDVPAIQLRIFWVIAQVDAFADECAVVVAVLEFAADPGEAFPAPDGAIVDVELKRDSSLCCAPFGMTRRWCDL